MRQYVRTYSIFHTQNERLHVEPGLEFKLNIYYNLHFLISTFGF